MAPALAAETAAEEAEAAAEAVGVAEAEAVGVAEARAVAEARTVGSRSRPASRPLQWDNNRHHKIPKKRNSRDERTRSRVAVVAATRGRRGRSRGQGAGKRGVGASRAVTPMRSRYAPYGKDDVRAWYERLFFTSKA